MAETYPCRGPCGLTLPAAAYRIMTMPTAKGIRVSICRECERNAILARKKAERDSRTEKVCRVCHKGFPPTPKFFNRNRDKVDGLTWECKRCLKIMARVYRHTPGGRHKVRKYREGRRESIAKRRRIYQATDGYKRSSAIRRNRMPKNQVRALNIVGSAVRYGRLRKPRRCQECNRKQPPLWVLIPDYRRPLEGLRWLCPTCHVAKRRGAEAIATEKRGKEEAKMDAVRAKSLARKYHVDESLTERLACAPDLWAEFFAEHTGRLERERTHFAEIDAAVAEMPPKLKAMAERRAYLESCYMDVLEPERSRIIARQMEREKWTAAGDAPMEKVLGLWVTA